jgi:hypothetical protein
MNIALHMERLVLDGVVITPAQRALLQTALEGELALLLGEGGLPPALAQGAQPASIGAAPIAFAPGGDPVRLGQQIARSVYGALAP